MDKRDITFILGLIGIVGIGLLFARRAGAAMLPQNYTVQFPDANSDFPVNGWDESNVEIQSPDLNPTSDNSVDIKIPGATPIAFSFDNWWKNMSATRGERNNNPGNIRKSPVLWQGLATDQSDPAFATFINPEYGIRALGKLLQNYGKNGYVTITDIINRYAPGTENDSVSYINHVTDLTGYDATKKLDLDDESVLRALVNAIIIHENGRNIYADNGQLDAGLALV